MLAAVSACLVCFPAQLEEKEQVIDNMADSKKLLEEKSDMLALVDAYLVRAIVATGSCMFDCAWVWRARVCAG